MNRSDYFKEGSREGMKHQNPEKIFGPIRRDKNGKIIEGLPENLSEKDVRTFIGDDGKEYAANPSQEVLQAEKLWRDELNPEE